MDRLTVAWWNTGLIPLRGKPPPGRLPEVVIGITALLEAGADVIALGEVSEDSLSALVAHWAPGSLSWRFTGHRNIGLLVRGGLARVVAGKHAIAQFGTSQCHAGSWFDLHVGQIPLRLWLVHWPSDLTPTGPMRRIEAARVLRDEVERTFKDCGGTLVIGDFNEEPYTENVTWNLRSSRERRQVVDGRATFYNPFWRHQGELDALDQPMSSWRGPGTLRLGSAQNELTRWKLVDFALVDRDLLTGSSGWQFIESSAMIVPIEEGSFGDHLPIMITANYAGDPQEEGPDDLR